MQLLRAVVVTGSVTVAATNLGYTPSAISQQLAILEREAGMTLLEKVGRGVRPTEAGRMVADRAGSIGTILSELSAELDAVRNGQTGRVRLRWAASVGAALIPRAVTMQRHKRPEVRVEPCLSPDPLREVLEEKADIALVTAPPEATHPADVRMIHLLDDPFYAVLPADHPLAAQEVVDLAQLAEETWIEKATGVGHDAVHERVLQACASVGFSPNVSVRADDFLTAQGFVASGLGILLASRLGLHAGNDTRVVARPVQRPELIIRIYLAVRESSATQTVVADMIDELQQEAASTGRS